MTEGGDREGFVPGLPHLVCKSLMLTKVEQAKWNEKSHIASDLFDVGGLVVLLTLTFGKNFPA